MSDSEEEDTRQYQILMNKYRKKKLAETKRLPASAKIKKPPLAKHTEVIVNNKKPKSDAFFTAQKKIKGVVNASTFSTKTQHFVTNPGSKFHITPCDRLSEIEFGDHKKIIVTHDGILPSYENRFIAHTNNPDVIVVYSLYELKNVKAGDENIAYHAVPDPVRLGIRRKWTRLEISRIADEQMCRRTIAAISNIDINFVTTIILPAIGNIMTQYMPNVFKDIYGYFGRIMPDWMRSVGKYSAAKLKKLISSPTLMMFSIMFYMLIKATVCIMWLPDGANRAVSFLKSRIQGAYPVIEIMMDAVATIASCVTGTLSVAVNWGLGLITCITNSVSLIFNTLRLAGGWIPTLLRYMSPYFGNNSFQSLSSFTAADIGDWWSAAGIPDVNSVSIMTRPMYLAVVFKVFINFGPRLLDFFSIWLGGFFPQLLEIKKWWSEKITPYVEAIKSMRDLINRLHIVEYTVFINFIYSEVITLFGCISGRGNCCFSDELLESLKKSDEREHQQQSLTETTSRNPDYRDNVLATSNSRNNQQSLTETTSLNPDYRDNVLYNSNATFNRQQSLNPLQSTNPDYRDNVLYNSNATFNRQQSLNPLQSTNPDYRDHVFSNAIPEKRWYNPMNLFQSNQTNSTHF